MSIEDVGGTQPLEYFPCRYENLRGSFRGPQRDVTGRFVAFLGSTETYGKFIASPFPTIVEARLGIACVNFGRINAGLDAIMCEPALLEMLPRAQAVVLQVMGAQNMSNRFYKVHPRHNDRFVSAGEGLCALYPEVDFAEVHYTRHLMQVLQQAGAERFDLVRSELQSAWSARMATLVQAIDRPVVLVRFGPGGAGPGPMFVTEAMIAALEPRCAGRLDFAPSPEATDAALESMIFGAGERAAACELPGAQAHEELAEALSRSLRRLLDPAG